MSVLYVVKEGLSGFRRAKLAAIGSIMTITIALLLLGIFYVISTNTSRIMETIREKVELEAFLQEPVAPQRIADIEKALLAIEGIDHVQFVSKEEAAKIFKQEFGEDITSVLQFNPLPPSFRIFPKDEYRTTSKAEAITKRASGIQGISNVVYRKEILEFIEKQTKTLYTIGIGLGVFIAISAIFLVSNTIRLAIYAKSKAVEMMKLVGASRGFVRAPFLIEGIVQGMVGGVLAAGIIYYVLSSASTLVSRELAEFLRIDVMFYPQIVLVGMFLGFFGSAISVRKFIGEIVAG